MSYRKVKPGESMFDYIEANKRRGVLVCDAYAHNSERGCPNPNCFKHPKRRRKHSAGNATNKRKAVWV